MMYKSKCAIVCGAVHEHAAIVYLLLNVNAFVCGCEKIALAQYSIELHGAIWLCVFVNMDVFALLPGGLCVGGFILQRSISCP